METFKVENFSMDYKGGLNILGPLILLCSITSTYFMTRFLSRDYGRQGVVAAADADCQAIGSDILNVMDGSAVDATIATMLCLGVKMPHAMGVGGGFNMVVYDRNTKKAEHIDAREVSPISTDFEKMKQLEAKRYRNYRKWGALSIGVPGELAGYWTAHQRHGKLPWTLLFRPTIRLAKYGFPMSRFTASALSWWNMNRKDLTKDESLCEVFCKADGTAKEEGDILYMTTLAKTLEAIARKGPQEFYNGKLTDIMIDELNSIRKPKFAPRKVFCKKDFTKYQVKIRKPFKTRLGDLTMYAPTTPGGGPVIGFMLKLMQGFKFTEKDSKRFLSKVDVLHKMTEVMKYGVAHRMKLGDTNVKHILRNMNNDAYILNIRNKIRNNTRPARSFKHYTKKLSKQDKGTLHISVLAGNGDAVSVTSSINSPLGSFHRSKATGIIFNNQMNDFTYSSISARYKDTDANLVGPSKRPQSSQSPSIFVDGAGEVRIVIGAAGGIHITNALLQVLTGIFWLGEDVPTAINKPRITNTLYPYQLRHEEDFNVLLLSHLKSLGHKTALFYPLPCISRVECILQHRNGTFETYTDKRQFVT